MYKQVNKSVMKKSNAKLELKDEGINIPTLANEIFAVPDTYFTTLESNLHNAIFIDNLPKENVFTIPTNYFNEFSVPIKPVLKVQKNYFQLLKYAVAASVVLALCTGLLFVNKPKNIQLSNDQIVENINKLEPSEIEQYANVNYTETPFDNPSVEELSTYLNN